MAASSTRWAPIKGGDDTVDYDSTGVSGSFYVTSGTITLGSSSGDVTSISGDLDGYKCMLTGSFGMYLELEWDSGASSGIASVSGEVTEDTMTFSGKLYLDTGSLPSAGDYDCDRRSYLRL